MPNKKSIITEDEIVEEVQSYYLNDIDLLVRLVKECTTSIDSMKEVTINLLLDLKSRGFLDEILESVE